MAELRSAVFFIGLLAITSILLYDMAAMLVGAWERTLTWMAARDARVFWTLVALSVAVQAHLVVERVRGG